MFYIRGRTVGLWCGREYWRDASWFIQFGWGEGSGKEADRLYRHDVKVEFRPWRSWFLWSQHLLTHERGEPVYQVRIAGFWRWPMSVSKW